MSRRSMSMAMDTATWFCGFKFRILGSNAEILQASVTGHNEHLHDIVKRLLTLLGYESIAAAGAKEGLEKAVSQTPDLVLLDIHLPDMDGRDTARLLRSNPVTKDVSILAFTGSYNELDDGKSLLEAGCDDYVLKPVTFQVLQEKLQRLLG